MFLQAVEHIASPGPEVFQGGRVVTRLLDAEYHSDGTQLERESALVHGHTPGGEEPVLRKPRACEPT